MNKTEQTVASVGLAMQSDRQQAIAGAHVEHSALGQRQLKLLSQVAALQESILKQHLTCWALFKSVQIGVMPVIHGREVAFTSAEVMAIWDSLPAITQGRDKFLRQGCHEALLRAGSGVKCTVVGPIPEVEKSKAQRYLLAAKSWLAGSKLTTPAPARAAAPVSTFQKIVEAEKSTYSLEAGPSASEVDHIMSLGR